MNYTETDKEFFLDNINKEPNVEQLVNIAKVLIVSSGFICNFGMVAIEKDGYIFKVKPEPLLEDIISNRFGVGLFTTVVSYACFESKGKQVTDEDIYTFLFHSYLNAVLEFDTRRLQDAIIDVEKVPTVH